MGTHAERGAAHSRLPRVSLIFVALLGGERGSKLVGSFWFALLKLVVSLIEALAKGFGKLFKKKMPKWLKEMVEHDH